MQGLTNAERPQAGRPKPAQISWAFPPRFRLGTNDLTDSEKNWLVVPSRTVALGRSRPFTQHSSLLKRKNHELSRLIFVGDLNAPPSHLDFPMAFRVRLAIGVHRDNHPKDDSCCSPWRKTSGTNNTRYRSWASAPHRA